MKQLRWFLIFPAAILLLSLGFCKSEEAKEQETAEESPFLNLHDTVGYVGMETCRSCHQDIFETYIHTGMGQSFGHATRERSDAEFGPHVVVYDSVLNFYYKPFWENDSFKVMEYRLYRYIMTPAMIATFVFGGGSITAENLTTPDGSIRGALFRMTLPGAEAGPLHAEVIQRCGDRLADGAALLGIHGPVHT